jgi:hypothetical protein
MDPLRFFEKLGSRYREMKYIYIYIYIYHLHGNRHILLTELGLGSGSLAESRAPELYPKISV